MLGWARCAFHKKRIGTRVVELMFCIWGDLLVTKCILVRPRHKTLTHYFSCLGEPGPVSMKKRARTRYVDLVFLHRVGSTGHIIIPMCPLRETSMHYFSCSGGPSAVYIKSALGHDTLNLCFCIQ
jgi:hypothetical protein